MEQWHFHRSSPALPHFLFPLCIGIASVAPFFPSHTIAQAMIVHVAVSEAVTAPAVVPELGDASAMGPKPELVPDPIIVPVPTPAPGHIIVAEPG